jgi:TPR repeat protein
MRGIGEGNGDRRPGRFSEPPAAGNSIGKYNVASRRETGGGVTKDLVKARWWYRKSAAERRKDAKQWIRRIPGTELSTKSLFADHSIGGVWWLRRLSKHCE